MAEDSGEARLKAPAFRYARPDSLPAALELLAARRDSASVLAGGQSLLATLAMRLAQPDVLVDIGRLAELRGITETADGLRIGALTRHVDLLQSPLVAVHAPLIALAMPHIAHLAVRNRGTIGGSLSLADPSAELPACCVVLDARIELRSTRGTRTLPARDFFVGLYTTAREPDELLIAVHVPRRPGWRFAFRELARRHGDFAVVGVAAAAGEGRLDLVVFGSEPWPRLAVHAARVAAGQDVRQEQVRAAIVAALGDDLEPMPNLQGRADTKLRQARALAERALRDLAA